MRFQWGCLKSFFSIGKFLIDFPGYSSWGRQQPPSVFHALSYYAKSFSIGRMVLSLCWRERLYLLHQKDDRSRLEKLLFCYSSADKHSSNSITDILNRFAPSSFERTPSFIKLIIIIFFSYSIPSAFPSVIA